MGNIKAAATAGGAVGPGFLEVATLSFLGDIAAASFSELARKFLGSTRLVLSKNIIKSHFDLLCCKLGAWELSYLRARLSCLPPLALHSIDERLEGAGSPGAAAGRSYLCVFDKMLADLCQCGRTISLCGHAPLPGFPPMAA